MSEISELSERVARLEERLGTLMENDLPHMREDIKFIRNRMNGYRPPWSVVMIIIVLSNIVTALIRVVL